MMKKWKTTFVVSAALMIVFGASSAFAQYGSGACGPTCDVPIASAPTCDVPTCEPTCSVPTGVNCGEAYGCDAGFCGNDCYGSSCFDLCGFLNGTLNVAISPFRWIACELTDGVYPDCGCAPRLEKTKCDPCTICGDYVGGCNDQCEGLPCGSCNDCYGQGTVVSQHARRRASPNASDQSEIAKRLLVDESQPNVRNVEHARFQYESCEREGGKLRAKRSSRAKPGCKRKSGTSSPADRSGKRQYAIPDQFAPNSEFAKQK